MRLRLSQRLSRGERGSATVLAVAMVSVLLCVAAAGIWLGSVVVARHRAQAAADLAAVAAAGQLPQGPSAACAQAAVVIRRMRAGEAGCRLDGLDVIVVAEVPVAHLGVASATARAGPTIDSTAH